MTCGGLATFIIIMIVHGQTANKCSKINVPHFRSRCMGENLLIVYM